MKRSLTLFSALALSSPALAVESDVILRGTFAAGLSYFNSNDAAPGSVTDVDLENNASNFRISASADEKGLNAFMVYERGASNDRLGVEDVREFYGGITGSVGTLIYGRKATDYRIAGARLDPFFNTSLAGWDGSFASEGASYGLSNLTNGFTSNTVSFQTPAASGFSANVAAYINDNNSVESTGDKADFGVGVSYANSNWVGLEVGVQMLDLSASSQRPVANSPGEAQAIRLHGSMGKGVWAVGLSVEYVDVEIETDPRTYGMVSTTYQIAEKWTLAGSIGNLNNTPTTDGTGITLGAFHALTRNFSYYMGARYVAMDDLNDTKNATLATGVRFDFESGF